MIEVVFVDGFWRWTMIDFCGRILVYNSERFLSDMAAFQAAKAYRSTFWRIADETDWRMARNN